MKHLFILIAFATTSAGCASLGDYLGNRLTCTVANDKAYVVSLWGWLGIASEVVEQDAEVICKESADAGKE
jgi:hypothetical protein